MQHCHCPNTFVQVKSNNILTHSLNSCSVSSVSGFGNLSAEALCRRDGLPAQWVLNHSSVHFSQRNWTHVIVFYTASVIQCNREVTKCKIWIKHFQLAVVLLTFYGFSSQVEWETADVPYRWSWRSWRMWTRPSSLPKSRMTENSGRISSLTL